jgi:hypothetical protein
MTTFRRLIGIAGGDRGTLVTTEEVLAMGMDPALMIGRYLEPIAAELLPTTSASLPTPEPVVVASEPVVVVSEPVAAEGQSISASDTQQAIWGDDAATEDAPKGITDAEVNAAVAAVQGVHVGGQQQPKQHHNNHNKKRR